MTDTENFIAKLNYYSTCKKSGDVGNSYIEAMESGVNIVGKLLEKGQMTDEAVSEIGELLDCINYFDTQQPNANHLFNHYSNVVEYSINNTRILEEHQKVA